MSLSGVNLTYKKLNKMSGYYRIELTKEKFHELFRKSIIDKNKKAAKHEEVHSGIWPFKVDSGTLINNNNAIFFACEYNGLVGIKKVGLFAINGIAISHRKSFKAKLIKRIQLSPSKNSVNDIIMFGLKLNPYYKLTKKTTWV